MSRVVVLVVVLWNLGCGSTAPKAVARPGPATDPAAVESPQAAATSGAAPAQGEPAPWWCFSFGDGEVGACQRTRLRCEATRGYLVGTSTNPNEQISQCAPQQNVVCFDTQKARGGAAETLCHPTFAICRSHLDHVKSGSADDLRAVSDCRAASPGASVAASNTSPDRDEAVHWWCHTANHGRVGSCDRSRRQCEDSRDHARRIWSSDPDQVSDCASQQSAICFETQSVQDGSQHMHCGPTSATCQSFVDYFERQKAPGVRVVSACHPVE